MRKTNWDKVAHWYEKKVGSQGSDYHEKVIFPVITKLLNLQKSDKFIDIACGQGALLNHLASAGAEMMGIDASQKLIDFAKKRNPKIKLLCLDATDLSSIESNQFDAATCVLALQNIENFQNAIKEASRVLKKGGRFVLALNHPCFRIPRQSGWGFDEKRKLSFRRIDSYMSEQNIPIQMHPGAKPDVYTWTFHRPISTYINLLGNNNLFVSHFEELLTHRKNQQIKSQKAENRAKQEIPLFLIISTIKQ